MLRLDATNLDQAVIRNDSFKCNLVLLTIRSFLCPGLASSIFTQSCQYFESALSYHYCIKKVMSVVFSPEVNVAAP